MLKSLIKSAQIRGKTLSFEGDTINTAHEITVFLGQAQTLGHGYAEKQLAQVERGVVSALSGGVQWAIDQASNLIDRALSWAKELFASKVEDLGDEASAEDIEQALEGVAENVAETLATTEIQDVVEKTVMNDLQDAGVAMVEIVCDPDACDLCMANADAGPIPIGTAFPSGETSPPFHRRCRCGMVIASL